MRARGGIGDGLGERDGAGGAVARARRHTGPAGIGKAELAQRLGWHLPQVDRVLDVQHRSRLDRMEAALGAIGRRLEVIVRDDARDDTSSMTT